MTAFDATARRSPLDGASLLDGLREVPSLAQLNLRIDAPKATAVALALGFDLPLQPNTVAGDDRLAALWLGPDEWLVVGRPGEESRIENGLLAMGGSVVDVSANRTTLELRGTRTRELLEFGCPIDLYPGVFGPGRCAQTLLARANVILWFVTDDPEPTYRLLVRPSFAGYVAAWLADAEDGLID
jgi:sarcosine oxidase, subunit gamma